MLGVLRLSSQLKFKKGEEYTIKYTLSSSKCDKWVFVKIADKKENFAYGKWVKIKKGKSVSVNETFKAYSRFRYTYIWYRW